MSTHSLPVSSALCAETLLSNELEGLPSHRAEWSSVIPECCFPLLFIVRRRKAIVTNQGSLQRRICEWTADCKRKTHNCPGEEMGLRWTPWNLIGLPIRPTDVWGAETNNGAENKYSKGSMMSPLGELKQYWSSSSLFVCLEKPHPG